MGEYEPNDSRDVTLTRENVPGEPPKTGPREDEMRERAKARKNLEREEEEEEVEAKVKSGSKDCTTDSDQYAIERDQPAAERGYGDRAPEDMPIGSREDTVANADAKGEDAPNVSRDETAAEAAEEARNEGSGKGEDVEVPMSEDGVMATNPDTVARADAERPVGAA